ncbi:unnamed protein product [Caenorhabditis angaria]|uniref:DUF4019 domain-containing protein n=1 Tax=Caenorhabditis angaria TaxID=860376 RepID=A0A9P1ITK2_9PELO|nr:unnamed protein product [Caenorhabditis angaria]
MISTKTLLIFLAFFAQNSAANPSSFSSSDPKAIKAAQHFVDSLWKMHETIGFKKIGIYFTDNFERITINKKAQYLKEVQKNFGTALGLRLFYKYDRIAYFEQKEDGIKYLTFNVRRNSTYTCTTNLIENPAILGGYQIRRITDFKA